ncbi:TPA: ParA family protein [Streptococcus agalactiae]
MKIVSFVAIKGGVGKTTLAFNFGEWLAKKGKKVLFIDLDHQCNLSQTYEIYDTEGTIANAFKDNDVSIIDVKDNISIIPGSMQLDTVEKELENNDNKNMLLYMWLEDHYEKDNLDQFDFVLIDCHPDFSTATKNAIAVSHYIISPLIPSEFGFNAKYNLEKRMEMFRKDVFDYRTRESYITAELFFLANMIKHNTNSSKSLISSLEAEAKERGKNDLIGIVPDKELFNHSTIDKISISDMALNDKTYRLHKQFFDKIEETFASIYDRINS